MNSSASFLFSNIQDPWLFTLRVNHNYSRVRRISETQAVKLPGGFDQDISNGLREERFKELQEELRIQTIAYNAGLAVPKPEGIIEVAIKRFLFFPEKYQGLVMEYVPGINLAKLYHKDKDAFFEASRQRDAEIQKARNLGLLPGDHLNLLNTMWNPEKQKAYLIDFHMWGTKE